MTDRERFPRRAGVATLVARRALTPRMVRVTLEADGFGDDWPTEQPGEILTLLFPPVGEDVVLPEQGWRFPPGVEQPWRNYTVRRHDPRTRRIEVDVVLHEPRGPACTEAARAAVGAPVGYAGPRVDFAPREDAEWLLLCGDETALPAIAAILEAHDERTPALALVEVDGPDEERALDLPRADVRWLPVDAYGRLELAAPRRRTRRDDHAPRRCAARTRPPRRRRPGLGRRRVARRPRRARRPAR